MPLDEDDELENSAEGFDDFVPAVFAKNADEAEQYRELLEDNDIPAMIGDSDELDDDAPASRRRRRISRGVPVLVPEALLDEASEVIAENDNAEDDEYDEKEEVGEDEDALDDDTEDEDLELEEEELDEELDEDELEEEFDEDEEEDEEEEESEDDDLEEEEEEEDLSLDDDEENYEEEEDDDVESITFPTSKKEKPLQSKGKLSQLIDFPSLCDASEILDRRVLVPNQAGVYVWYFDVLPGIVPDGRPYVQHGNHKLLYVGMADGSLRDRIKSQHLSGNAKGSSLRQSLGCLLLNQLNLVPQKGTSGFWFGTEGEKKLTDWMKVHAKVAWVVDDDPETLELTALEKYGHLLPLNTKKNPRNEFFPILSAIKSKISAEVKGT